MKIDDENIDSRWPEIRQELKKSWSQLSTEELDATKGDRDEVVLLLKKKFGQDQENNKTKVEKIFHSFEIQNDETLMSM